MLTMYAEPISQSTCRCGWLCSLDNVEFHIADLESEAGRESEIAEHPIHCLPLAALRVYKIGQKRARFGNA